MKIKRIVFLLALSLQLCSMTVSADMPGQHPGLSHMMTDLRQAKWYMAQRSDDAAVRPRLAAALSQIDVILTEAETITVDMGKSVPVPSLTTSLTLQVRLQKAAYFLQKAQHDLEGEVDRPDNRAARNALKLKIDSAIKSVNQAVVAAKQ